jgi:type I restriction enzyme S subunit
MSWKEASIESLCLAVASGGTPSRARSEYWENGTIPWLKTGELNDGIVQGAEEKITKEGLANSSAKIFPKNTVLMAMYGDGRTITTLSILGRESATNQACAAMIANPEVCDYRFLFQALKLHRHKLLSLVVAGAQRNLSLGIVKRFAFPVPDLPTQQRIAGILSAYDDLIENNRRRIGLLEQAARLLYREWFVHLRFPGHETAKIVDGVPEGWERATLSDHVELIKDAVQPSGFRPDDVHIGLEHIPRRSFVLSEWEPTEGLESHKFRFETGDIIFGKIRPYFHKVGFALRDGVASSDAFVWRVKDQKAWSLIVCATSSDHFVAVASKTVKEGSKMPRADWKVLARYEVPRPTDDVLAEFDGRVRPIADECRKLALQNRALTRARDLLLPRLMDGRIPV